MSIRNLLAVFIAALLLQSCFNDKRDQLYPCDTSDVTYSGFVSQIVGSTTCAKSGCHINPNAQGGIVLTNYADVRKVALDHRLIGTIADSPGYRHMPDDGGKLDACVIAKINAWVNQGAPQN
jgi:hypothetical protein